MVPTEAGEPVVRPACHGDGDRVFTLAGVLALSFVPQRDAFDTAFDEVLAAPDAHLLVADSAAGVVGYLLGVDHPAFFANGRVGWIEELVVDPDRRHRGVGRALVHEFERAVRDRGGRLSALATTRAGPFYSALGYADHAAYYRKVF